MPAGTEAPWDPGPDGVLRPVADWNGTYFSDDSQTVNKDDASNLADGLEIAEPQEDRHTEHLRNMLIEFWREGAFRIG